MRSVAEGPASSIDLPSSLPRERERSGCVEVGGTKTYGDIERGEGKTE